MKIVISILVFVLTLSSIQSKLTFKDFFKKPFFKDFYGRLDVEIREGDAGDPLILTDLIRNGNIEEAREKAKVDPILGVESYSGYFTTDAAYDSNMFFWFFPSQSDYNNDPVIVWLQGGPGATSMFGLFQENGPFKFVGENELVVRNTSWSQSNNVIYIDQPVGTGWSYTNGGYAQNQTKIGEDLYETLIQFFTLFSELQTNDFFITGESYAGKFIPAIGYTIHHKNPSADLKINLKGLAIGDGLINPRYQSRYSKYLYHHGLIDLNIYNIMVETEDIAVRLIDLGKYTRASDFFGQNMGTVADSVNLDWYNYLTLHIDNSEDDYMNSYFQREDVRKAIHVGNTVFIDDNVSLNLIDDYARSQADALAELLCHYRVLIYNGQMDIIVTYSETLEFLQNFDFSSAVEYSKAERRQWRDPNNENIIAGYVKVAGNLTELMVRNSGHMVPSDQPEWALDMINKFVRNQPIAS